MASLREQAAEAIRLEVRRYAELSHSRNYHKLHVWRDGTVSWFDAISQSEDIIDSQADHFCAVESVAQTGTGSCACNCDWCNDVYDADTEALALEQGREYDRAAKYETAEDAIHDAVCESDLSDIEAMMLSALDAIDIGYFNDEQEAQ